MDTKDFEIALAKIFLKEKNDLHKEYYDRIVIVNNLLIKIDKSSYYNLYPNFMNEILSIDSVDQVRKIEKVLKNTNKNLNRNYAKFSKELELSLYEKELLRQVEPQSKTLKHHIIMESLKILHLLRLKFANIKTFEVRYEETILLSLDRDIEIDSTVKILLNKCFELLSSFELINSKEHVRCFILLIDSLILFENITKERERKELLKKYRYKDLVFISDYIQEFNEFKNKKRGTIVLKNILSMIFKRIKIEKQSTSFLKKEMVKIFNRENSLKEYSLANQTWYNFLWNNRLFNYVYEGNENKMYELKKETTSVLSLNNRDILKKIKYMEEK